jgi:sugar phosphate isomerase/epimerase
MAKMAAQIGFDGVDLTVRPNGHVLPERVSEDLPKAIDAMGEAGFQPLMMTTAVDNAHDPVDKKLLETAAGLGIQYYRMNWLRYPEQTSIPEAINQFQHTIKDLSELNHSLGILGCYQNHSGTWAGASIHELYDMVEPSAADAMGVQYDIRHAVVEGGQSWETGLRLIEPRIRTLCLKDFRWEKIDGEWKLLNTPMGEGMVDFKKYFGLLKKYRIQVPVSMHYEYDLGGADKGRSEITIKPDQVYEAMHRDLEYVHKLYAEAKA